MSKKIFVVGHKNPDTDSVASAFVWSRVLNKMGISALPAVAGEVNKETKLAFSKAQVKIPQKIPAGKEVFLVDHNEKKQMVKGIKKIVGVIDHHKLSGLVTDEPIFFRNEPMGSTCSIIAKIALEKNLELQEEEAFLLICGIVSDTLKFNSPTTTREDKEFAEELAEILEIDLNKLAEELFQAKSDFSGMSLNQIVKADYKDFEMGGKKVGIGVCETASNNFFKDKKENILQEIKKIKKEKEVDYLFFAVIDIIKKNTLLFCASPNDLKLAARSFGVSSKENPVILKGVASRKKQIVPPLSKNLEN